LIDASTGQRYNHQLSRFLDPVPTF
jgi:hypothetical protein